MSNLLGGGAVSSQNSQVFGLQVQTSIYASVIPCLFGTAKIGGNVIWNGDWKANPVSSGGKGSKTSSGGKYGGSQQYNYQTAIEISLGFGPINRLMRIWFNNTVLTIASVGENFTVPLGGGSVTVANSSAYAIDVGAVVAQSYSISGINDTGSPGSRTISGVARKALTKVGGAPAAGQYSQTGGTYTFNAAQAGLTVTITYYFFQSTPSYSGDPVTSLNLTLISGALGQAPWTYLSSNHPAQALGYSEIASVANQALNLGSSGSVPNISYEAQGSGLIYPGGLDCLPTDIMNALLTGGNFVGMNPALFSILPEVANYCLANNIFCSQYLDKQQPGSEWLSNLCKIANCAPVQSDGIIKFRSYGDTSAFNNGVQFTPSTQPIYDLTDDDLMSQGEYGPILVERPASRKIENSTIVEWTNRGNGYQTETAEVKDQLQIDTYGYRQGSTLTLHEITSQPTAQLVASVDLKRKLYIRNKYTIKLPLRFMLLEPMDIVSLPPGPEIGSTKIYVRITSISENDKGELTMECEDFPWSISAPTLYPRQMVGGSTPGYFANPGAVNKPAFIELPTNIAPDNTLGIALSGQQNWGGAKIFVSRDGATYTEAGSQFGPATMGALTGALPYGNDPDLSHTLAVSLSESYGTLASVSAAQWNAFDSLVAIDRELLAYETASLTGTAQYNLTNLRRGIYNSQITAHLAGAQFAVVDGQIFQFTYLPSDVGKTLYFKFCSFNQAGAQTQDISQVTAYPVTVLGHVSGRDPMVWGAVGSGIGPAVSQNYSKSTLDITGVPICNTVSQTLTPAKIDFTPTFAAGSPGIAFPSSFVACVVSYDSSGNPSDISNLCLIVSPGPGSNLVAAFNITWDPSAVAYELFFGPDIFTMNTPGKVTPGGGMPSSLTINSYFVVEPMGYGPPDVRMFKYHVRAKRTVHAGIFADNVLSNTLSSVTLGQSLMTGGTLVGRTLSLVGKFGNPATQLYADQPILSNTTNSFGVISGAGSLFSPSDLIVVRCLATTFSATSIGDSLFANGYNGGTGLTVNAEVGNIVRITKGTGAGQWRYIISNTSTVLNIGVPWDTLPDSTSQFIVEEPTWRVDITTAPAPSSLPPNSAQQVIASISMLDLMGYIAFFCVLPQDIDGVDAEEVGEEYKDMYVYPIPSSVLSTGYTSANPLVGSNVTLDVFKSGNLGSFKLAVNSGTPFNFLPPIYSGPGGLKTGMKFTLHMDTDGTPGRPKPTFSNAAGGFVNNTAALIAMRTTASTRTSVSFVLHDNGLWAPYFDKTGISLT